MKDWRENRRSVEDITIYPSPKEIYQLVTQKRCKYKSARRVFYWCRDRAFMAMAFGSAGRVTAITGGERYGKVNEKLEVVGEHKGICRENLEFSDKFLFVKGMGVVKRSPKVIKKHGKSVTVREPFVFPLKCGLYENAYWDQLVPFGWLIAEYLQRFEPKGRLFKFDRFRGWWIINHVTGKFPNWFRAQSEHFYGYYLLTDSVKLAKFVKVVDSSQVKRYIGYDWRAQLKVKERKMDFEWISEVVDGIKSRMG